MEPSAAVAVQVVSVVAVTTVVARTIATAIRMNISSASWRSTASPRWSRVAVGYGKAKEVPAAIAKGVEEAKKHFFKVPLVGRTITHPVIGEKAAGVVLLRPASPGTGVIAGGSARAVLECAGVQDVLAKSLGSSNAINVVHATVAALQQLEEPEEVARRRGKSVEDVAPAAMLRARKEADEAAAAARMEEKAGVN